jgi:hypothetical protein
MCHVCISVTPFLGEANRGFFGLEMRILRQGQPPEKVSNSICGAISAVFCELAKTIHFLSNVRFLTRWIIKTARLPCPALKVFVTDASGPMTWAICAARYPPGNLSRLQ